MKIAICMPLHNEPKALTDWVKQQISVAVGPGYPISIFHDSEGKGKGYALKRAVMAVEADYYIFIDGDGDIHPFQIRNILYYLRNGYDVVVGKKGLPHRWDRRILTYLSRWWVRLLFGLTIDTQTGLKGFNYKPEWLCSGWAFDIEVLWRAKHLGKKMIETPVHATVSSGKSWKDIFSTLRDTIMIRGWR